MVKNWYKRIPQILICSVLIYASFVFWWPFASSVYIRESHNIIDLMQYEDTDVYFVAADHVSWSFDAMSPSSVLVWTTDFPCPVETYLCDRIQWVTDLENKTSNYFSAMEQEKYYMLAAYLLAIWDTNTGISEYITSIDLRTDVGGSRGYATHSHITIHLPDIATYSEFLQVLNHELWHVFDLAVVYGKSSALDPVFTEFTRKRFAIDDPSLQFYAMSRLSETRRKSDAKVSDFCSEYGMVNPFEDLAECINLYVFHHDAFVLWAEQSPTLQEKYQWIDAHIGQRYLRTPTSFQQKKFLQQHYENGTRPRDTTRLYHRR